MLVIVLMLSFSTAMFAESPNQVSQGEINTVKKNLGDLGVDEGNQNKLIDKLLNGEVWDSMNPEMTSKAKIIKSKKYDAQGIVITTIFQYLRGTEL